MATQAEKNKMIEKAEATLAKVLGKNTKAEEKHTAASAKAADAKAALDATQAAVASARADLEWARQRPVTDGPAEAEPEPGTDGEASSTVEVTQEPVAQF